MDNLQFLKVRRDLEWYCTRDFMRSVEEHGLDLRRQAGLMQLEKLNPTTLAKKLGVKIVRLDDLPSLPAEARQRLGQVDVRAWSGIGIPLPDGQLVIILHPAQTDARAAVTTMEEIAHAYYGHKPTRIFTLPGGLSKREYEKRSEREAYFTGAAALLPSEAVGKALWNRHPAISLAANYGVSLELVEFRIKTLGLWPDYKTSQPNELSSGEESYE